MAAPVLTPLPASPTRANPADFSARADSFLAALPGFVTQLNELVAYWNTNLDTSAFINRNVASTMLQTLTFALPPVMQASATTGEQVALTLSKGTTQRQAVRLGDDGSINLVPLNGAVALLKVNGQAVYHAGNKPTAADLGLVSSGSFTATGVRDLLLQADGAGSGVDADLLDGQQGSYYLSAANLTGTLVDARIPTSIVRTSRNISTGDGLSGGGNLSGDRTLSVDASVARRNAANVFSGTQTVIGQVHLRALSSASPTYDFHHNTDGVPRGLIYTMPTGQLLGIRAYAADGVAYKDATLNGNNGHFSAPAFVGNGSLLTELNASQLTGGTIPDARIASSIARSATSIVAGDGLSGGGTIGATRTLSVNSSVVRTTRSLTAGLGLTGGGTLGSDREIALGTPSSITADSTNSRTSTSHTHALSSGTVGELMALVGTQSVGTFSMMRLITTSGANPGTDVAGSNLRFSNTAGSFSSTVPSGTYRCMGYIPSGASSVATTTTLWKKVAG